MTLRTDIALVASREDDLELCARCLSGDRSAQRTLFQRERRRVHATLFRIVGHNHGIEDLLQEVFLGVFRSLHQFRGEARLSTWIDRCTVRIAFDHLRKGRRARLEVVSDSLSDSAPRADDRMLSREVLRRLYTILDGLEAKMRIAYALHVLEGRPMAEVAELTSATVVATKVRVYRARRYVEQRAKNDALLSEFAARVAPHDSEEEP